MKQLLFSFFPDNQPDKISLSLLLTCFLVGIAGAFTFPTMSLFMAQEVGVRPSLIGLFFVVMTVSGVLISQAIGWWSDQGIDRKRLILFCNTMGAIGFTIFAFSRDFWLLLIGAAIFISSNSAALPQIFALAREILDKQKRPSEKFSSVLRAQISLGWVIGPPIAFFIANVYGFMALFLLAALMFILLLILVQSTLPKIAPKSKSTSNNRADSLWRDKNIMLLAVAFVFMYCSNNMYLISMPLYIANDLGLDASLAGLMMGVAAFIEIPIMLLCGTYALRVGKKRLITAAILSGCVFYVGVIINTSMSGFLLLQFFNGIFIAVTAALGISYFQDLKPNKIGQVTTLYSNAIKSGGVIGGAFAGMIAEIWSFHTVFLASLIICSLSFVIILKVKDA